MIAISNYKIEKPEMEKTNGLQQWQRVTLLCIIGYEAAGCLVGGGLLIAKPDGKLMDMPVDMMHGVFRDFFIPGLILFALGVLNTMAFVAVFRKRTFDWIMICLGLGGLLIWFVVEIIILQELHWLHYMWGFPVFLGLVMMVPLLLLRHESTDIKKALLICGILSSAWYAVINIVVPAMYEDYSMAAFTVSELSAIGAPTRILWVLLVLPYPLLFAAFGWGVLESAGRISSLRVIGSLIIVYCIINFYWPPMHQRAVIGSGGGTLTDTLHIGWAMMTLLFMMILMGFGAAGLGKRFRLFTIATWAIFLLFGILTFMESPGIAANLPTPRIGIWERINISVFLVWVVALSVTLLREQKSAVQLNVGGGDTLPRKTKLLNEQASQQHIVE